MGELPSYDLELKAADQRRRLHRTVAELRSRMKEDFDIKKRVGQHMGAVSAIAAVFALGLGYSLAGLFVRH
ncbi:MAG TPA: hypothetical protein VH596_17170 [Terriglobales bacterium]|jgi:hypothetical protein